MALVVALFAAIYIVSYAPAVRLADGWDGLSTVYAPVEVIHAAGLMPVGLFGAGDKIELSHAEARFQSFICSIAKS